MNPFPLRSTFVLLLIAAGAAALSACSGGVDTQVGGRSVPAVAAPDTSGGEDESAAGADTQGAGGSVPAVGASDDIGGGEDESTARVDTQGAGGSAPAAATPDELGRGVDENMARVDTQGAVEITVLPLDLNPAGEGTLDFQISMNTHSVDLSMDLAELATLETDTGVSFPALDWSGGSGHHVQGVLRFSTAGSYGLEGAGRLKLAIRGVDAPERVFEWDLPAAP